MSLPLGLAGRRPKPRGEASTIVAGSTGAAERSTATTAAQEAHARDAGREHAARPEGGVAVARIAAPRDAPVDSGDTSRGAV